MTKKVNEEYWVNGIRHREDGPAYRSWFKSGQRLSEEYWINGTRIIDEWFIQFGKDIHRDFTNETIRNMILNIYGVR